MKVQTTAIVAIVAVFAIVLASASGVTYSWFTDSDEAEIDVSTAKVQMDVTFQYLDADGVWKDFDKNNVDKQVLTIENLAPGQSYYMRAVYSNNVSTIETAHKLYATISGDISADMTQNVKFNDEGVRVGDFDISGDSYDVIPVGGLPGLTDGTIYYHSFKLVAGTDWSVGSSGFKLTVKSDLVQVDKVISKVPVIDGEATTKVFDSNGSIPVNVEFIDLNATDAYLEVKITENAGVVTDDLILSFKLDSATVADVGFIKAIVTMIVPGDFSNGKVIYLKEGDSDTKSQPTVTALNYDSALDITTVMFTTDHFSDFAMIDCDADDDSELSALLETIKKNDALWNTPLDIKLGDGIYSKEYTINEYPEWNGVADGNYQTTDGKPCLQLTFTGDDVTFTNLVTINGAGTGVNGTGLSNGDAYVTFNGITFDAKDCTFGDDKYSVKMYAGAHEITFNDCDFINATHVLIGGSGQNHVDLVTFDGCTIDACVSGYCYRLIINDCHGSAGPKGNINNQSGGDSIVKITCSELENEGEYAIRTTANGGTYTIDNSTLKTSRSLLIFRASDANVAFTGCTLEYGTFVTTKNNDCKNNIVTIDGLVCDASTGRPYDTSWFEDENGEPKTEFKLSTKEELAGLSQLVREGNTFEGMTIKLDSDIDLCINGQESGGDPVTFRPIGDKATFMGTFDGQGHSIKNLYQNGWALGYEWGKYGSLGLFGDIENATIKNLTIEGAESLVEGGDVGGITGSASGKCVFENITIKDSIFATYNNGLGGIIGWSGEGEYTFKNITISEDVVLGGLWGSFDSSVGGVVGQAEPGATYNFENVTVSCRLDVYNDCTASYDYYNYRMCGMLMGRLKETTTIDGTNYPDTSKYNITCVDVTVNYGDWSYYEYCRAEGERAKRVQSGYSYGGIAEDYDHSVCTVHCKELIPFDQIFGGDQYAVKGLKTYNGVTVNYPSDDNE